MWCWGEGTWTKRTNHEDQMDTFLWAIIQNKRHCGKGDKMGVSYVGMCWDRNKVWHWLFSKFPAERVSRCIQQFMVQMLDGQGEWSCTACATLFFYPGDMAFWLAHECLCLRWWKSYLNHPCFPELDINFWPVNLNSQLDRLSCLGKQITDHQKLRWDT